MKIISSFDSINFFGLNINRYINIIKTPKKTDTEQTITTIIIFILILFVWSVLMLYSSIGVFLIIILLSSNKKIDLNKR